MEQKKDKFFLKKENVNKLWSLVNKIIIGSLTIINILY